MEHLLKRRHLIEIILAAKGLFSLKKIQNISLKIHQNKLGKRNRTLSLMIEMSNFLAAPAELNDLLDGALGMVMKAFHLPFGRIYLLDDEGAEYLHLAAHRGIEASGLEKVPISEGFTGKAAKTGAFLAQYVSELADQQRAALLARKGLLITVCVPLISRGRVGGVMNLASSQLIQLDQNKIDLLSAVGNQIAVAINNARLYADLKESVKTLEGKQDMIKFFTYSIAHDLKSPAIGVYGLTKRLQQNYGEQLDERGRFCCRQILKASEQMVLLVEKLNAFISTKETPMLFEKVDIQEVVEEIREEFSDALDEKIVMWASAENLPEIVADRMAMMRLFRNLTENALKYGGETLENIRITYGEEPLFHIFSFSDDGRGIKKGEREKVFHRFGRSDLSKGIPGSGLGLAIVREVAERHDGRVWIDPETTHGTTFHVAISKDLPISG